MEDFTHLRTPAGKEKANSESIQIQQSGAFLQAILNSTHYGIAVYEAMRDSKNNVTDFRVVYTNAEVPGNFGMRPDAVVGKMCSEVYPGIFENGVFDKMVTSVETGNAESYEICIPQAHKDMWLTASIEKVNDCVAITSKNITDEKNAALHLQAVNRLLANKNRELEHRILSEFSQSFSSYHTGKDFFDFLTLELYGKTGMDYILLGEITSGENGDEINCFSVCVEGKIVDGFVYPLKGEPFVRATKAKFYSYPENCRTKFADNDTLNQLQVDGYVGYPLFDTNGECIGSIIVMHRKPIQDNAYIESLLKIAAKRSEMELERQRNEKMLEEKNAELERNNKELESFNYIASHDLQEPLRKIQLFYSRILEKDRKNLSDESLNYFASINNAADRMQHLIQALLSYSTANFSGMSFEKTDLNKLLTEVKSDLVDMIEAKQATIEAEPLPKISVIPFQFRQLLSNIISNGMKYSRKDVPPVIRITSEITSGDETKGQRYLRIAIADNGIGFEQQYSEKIFELFQRLHGKTEFVGTGIGLSICKKIVQNHRGFIKAESQPGSGSVFSIYIPVKG